MSLPRATLLTTLALGGCSISHSGTSDTGEYSGAAADSGYWESDTDTDADTDADSDTDTDTDTDADTVADTGTDAGDTGVTDTATICDDTDAVALYLSPDDSNSMSSPAQVRDAVLGGWNHLQDVPIRTWEFMNYYGFDYTPATDGVAVTPEMTRDADGRWVLQIGVTSQTVALEDREPIDVVLVLDTSGSMAGEPLALLQESARAIASSLREGDRVSIVEWSATNAVDMEDHAVTGADDPEILAAIDGLASGGGTNLAAGLEAAYDIAARNYDPTRINRVVLISDGGANVGETSADLIGSHAGTSDAEGIYLVGVGVGTASTYDDTLMDTVTDVGRGASLFVGSTDEAWRQLGPDGFERVMDVAWRDVSVELDLPPGFGIVRFSGEEFGTVRSEIQPQHLAPNDTMVFYQVLDTCAPEQATDDAPVRVVVTYKDPVTFAERTTTTETTFGALLAGDHRLLDKGAAVYAYAEGLKAAQGVPGDGWHDVFAPAMAALATAEASNPGDGDLAEIRAVLETLGG